MRRFLALLLSVPLTAGAQQVGQNTSAQSNAAHITVNTQMVVETAVVTDKNGQPVQGLTAKDFSITEDGATQTISFCEHQNLPIMPAAAQPAPTIVDSDITVYDKLLRTQISPDPAGSPKYANKRLLALYFDMTAMPPADQMRALAAAQRSSAHR